MTRIKDILKEKGITVQELADMLEISRQALSKQIQGKMLLETAQRIALKHNLFDYILLKLNNLYLLNNIVARIFARI